MRQSRGRRAAAVHRGCGRKPDGVDACSLASPGSCPSTTRIHRRSWHKPAGHMLHLRLVLVPFNVAMELVKEVVDTCKLCGLWWGRTLKSMTHVWLTRVIGQLVHWYISAIRS